MGENLIVGLFGTITFYINRRQYFVDSEGKMRYNVIKEINTFEGMEIKDADKSRIWIEGMDPEIGEVFNVLRCNIMSFQSEVKPEIKI